MANGTSKLRLLLDMKSKLKMGLDSAKNQVYKATGGMQRRLDSFKTKVITNFAQIRNDIPGLGAAFDFLMNPITAVAGGIALIGMKARESIREAERFAYGFRELQMLNIDKSVKDMSRLKDMIRATSYEKGFDPTDTTKAFFDVQSTTGKLGGEVDRIVSKQGEFAKLMQADFNSWIGGTSKAMANYGFGVDKLDEFNRAAFATVKTGVTTFNELGKVQSVYAGAAASAKQNFASANKLFSIFTTKVKSADEAATLTKSLFNDLTKQTTIDAFKKVGINVYDANGRFRQADKLLLELQKKFRALGDSDQKIIELKNQFSGSEGLISFVQAATDKTNQLQQTISSFDTAEFALPKALEIAKNDINYINEQLENRTKVLMAKIGEESLPLKRWFRERQLGFLEGFNQMTEKQSTSLSRYRNKGANYILDEFPELSNPSKLSIQEFDSLMASLKSRLKIYEDRVNEPTMKVFRDENFGSLKNIFLKDSGFNDWVSTNFGKWNRNKFASYQFDVGALNAIRQLSREAIVARGNMDGIGSNNGGGTSLTNDESSSSRTSTNPNYVQSIARGSQTKSVTINIDSFIKSFTPTHQSINNMNKDELERWLSEVFLRVIHSAETTG